MKNFTQISHTLILRTLFTLSAVLLMTNCKKETPEEINEEEVINRVILSVTASDNSTIDYTWNDGETIPSISLTANESYSVSISFYDATDASDVEDITEEVIEEADEHYVFFEVASASVVISSASNDTTDSEGVRINLKTTWAAGDPSEGVVRAFLIHEPTSKTALTRAGLGGASDVELNFPVVIQ